MSKRPWAFAALGLLACFAGGLAYVQSWGATAETSTEESAETDLPRGVRRIAAVSNPAGLDSLAVVGRSVYWIEDPILYQVDIQGGAIRERRWGDPHALFVDGDSLYFLTFLKVMTLSTDQPEPTALFNAPFSMDGLAADEAHVYSASDGGPLWRISKIAGEAAIARRGDAHYVVGVDAKRVYFTDTGSPPEEGALRSVSKSEFHLLRGEMPSYFPQESRLVAKGIRSRQATLAPTGLYAATYRGEVIAIDPATRETRVLANGQANPSALVAHSGSLYWATPAGIYRVPEAGGPVTEVVSDPGVRDLDFADDEMVWLSKTGVFKMPVP